MIILKRVKLFILGASIMMLTACGGGGTSNVVETSPEETPQEVVMRAFEAQVNGDIDGFLSSCATEGASDEQISDNKAILQAFKNEMSLSHFSFETLATRIYQNNTLAIVRAITSYTVNNEFEERDGIFCYLKKEDNQWKLVRIFPDPLLNQEIFESSLELETNENSMLSLKNQKTFKSASDLHSLKELNDKLNDLLEVGYIDEAQKKWDTFFTILSQVPHSYTKKIALAETILGLGENFTELAVLYGYGDTSKLKAIKWSQVTAGLVQVYTDLSPTSGNVARLHADLLGATTNQVEYNFKIKQYIGLLRKIMRDPELGIEDPYLVAYEPNEYGDGINISTSDQITGQDGTKTYLYHFVTKITIRDPMAMGKELPFKVAGEVIFPDRYTPVTDELIKLGGKRLTNGNVRLALDITSMAQSVVQTLVYNPIIDFDFDTNGLKSGNIGTVTCSNSQSKQPFSILLSNGYKTKEVQVETFMKELYSFSNFEEAEKEYGIALYKGGNRDIDIYGVFGSLPEIKKLPGECLDITIEDEIIASLSVHDNINLQGLENGDTWMEVSLKSDKNFPPASFPVKVAESCPMFYNSGFDIGERHVITFGIEDKDKDGFFDDFLDCQYYESGEEHLKRTLPARDGKLEGMSISYYESGEKYAEYPMTKGKINGLAKAYYKSGQTYYEVHYVNDVKEGEYREYYESGRLYYSVPYENDVQEGEYKEYYDSDGLKIRRKIPLVNGIQEGTVYGYYESGQPNFELPYVNGQKNGTETYYHLNGDYNLNPWVNGQMNGNAPYYAKGKDGYYLAGCDIYVNDVVVGSCMPEDYPK